MKKKLIALFLIFFVMGLADVISAHAQESLPEGLLVASGYVEGSVYPINTEFDMRASVEGCLELRHRSLRNFFVFGNLFFAVAPDYASLGKERFHIASIQIGNTVYLNDFKVGIGYEMGDLQIKISYWDRRFPGDIRGHDLGPFVQVRWGFGKDNK